MGLTAAVGAAAAAAYQYLILAKLTVQQLRYLDSNYNTAANALQISSC